MDVKPQTLRELIAQRVEHTLAACTRCGKCYQACPMPGYSQKLAGASPGSVVTGILGMLRGEAPQEQALEWTRICTQSASCIPACPEGIDPMMMLRIARFAALGQLGGEKLIRGKDDPQFFLKIMAWARLQLSDQERAVWQKPPIADRPHGDGAA